MAVCCSCLFKIPHPRYTLGSLWRTDRFSHCHKYTNLAHNFLANTWSKRCFGRCDPLKWGRAWKQPSWKQIWGWWPDVKWHPDAEGSLLSEFGKKNCSKFLKNVQISARERNLCRQALFCHHKGIVHGFGYLNSNSGSSSNAGNLWTEVSWGEDLVTKPCFGTTALTKTISRSKIQREIRNNQVPGLKVAEQNENFKPAKHMVLNPV